MPSMDAYVIVRVPQASIDIEIEGVPFVMRKVPRRRLKGVEVVSREVDVTGTRKTYDLEDIFVADEIVKARM